MRENNTLAKNTQISVVDDDASMRQAINTLISSIGFNVAEFLSAEDFLNAGEFDDIDCLILDVRMPGLDGLELQPRLNAADIKTPIVFITAHYSEEQRRTAIP